MSYDPVYAKEYRRLNAKRIARQNRAWRKRHPNLKMMDRERGLKVRYGITHADYERMWEQQGGVCPLCGRPLVKGEKHSPVDHNHQTGEVRGILCHLCNPRVGWLERNLGRVSAYLQRGKKRGKTNKQE